MNWSANTDLSAYNTFGIRALAERYVVLRDRADVEALSEVLRLRPQPLLVLGGGSNLLLTGDVQGLTAHVRLKGISVVRQTAEHVWVRAGAGESWHELVLHALAQDWGGIENLSLIPGTVGAAPMQNIGAYGVELKDVFDSLEALHLPTGQWQHFDREACQFGYRESVFKHALRHQYLIASVTLRLSRRDHILHTGYGDIAQTLADMQVSHPTIQHVSQAVIRIRQSKLPDPAIIGNCGSFFKNPEIQPAQYQQLQDRYPRIPGYPTAQGIKVPAGWLIEQCGWKGRRIGPVGMHDRQALVLVNHGGATGAEAWALAMQVRADVRERFGIELTPEVNVWPA